MKRPSLWHVLCLVLLVSQLALAACAAPATQAPAAPAPTTAPAAQAPVAAPTTAATRVPGSGGGGGTGTGGGTGGGGGANATARAVASAQPAAAATQPAATPAPAAATKAPAAAPAAAPTPWAVKPGTLRLATTTSTADTGLLDYLLPDFEQANNVKVDVVAVGTGQAIAIGQTGDADVLLVHARAQEDKFVADKDARQRFDVMYNDFVLVGPKDDPAKAAAAPDVASALKAIATAQATFVSRGDKSGTNTKELGVWSTAKITPTKEMKWYNAIGQGMGDTLVFANEQKGYTLSDRGTWLATQSKLPNLKIVVGGDNLAENKDKSLLNPYGVMAVNPDKHPGVQFDLATKFVNWIISADTQKKIATFGVDKYGQPLFYPNAATK